MNTRSNNGPEHVSEVLQRFAASLAGFGRTAQMVHISARQIGRAMQNEAHRRKLADFRETLNIIARRCELESVVETRLAELDLSSAAFEKRCQTYFGRVAEIQGKGPLFMQMVGRAQRGRFVPVITPIISF